jgi:hypothetical protein
MERGWLNDYLWRTLPPPCEPEDEPRDEELEPLDELPREELPRDEPLLDRPAEDLVREPLDRLDTPLEPREEDDRPTELPE